MRLRRFTQSRRGSEDTPPVIAVCAGMDRYHLEPDRILVTMPALLAARSYQSAVE